jgi:hypothetical protein
MINLLAFVLYSPAFGIKERERRSLRKVLYSKLENNEIWVVIKQYTSLKKSKPNFPSV